ncbi:MAG TPA: cytochrome P450, partial [Acidimicrobiia bacterium]|nr:cytochrome P450 [Acidimicrobiia bacterium]
TVLRLLGFPLEDTEKLMQFKYEMLINLYSEDEAVRNRVQNEVRPQFNAYVKTQLDARRAMDTPPDDAMSNMLFGQLEGHEKMTDGEIARACMLLLTAGLDTVTQTLMLMFEYLATHPDVRHQLADKTVIPSAVEEFLRYFSIVTLARQCTEDTVLGGRQIKANQMVQVSPPSAGRDDKEFPDAATVDLRRNPNRHLAFGGGPHRCPGSHLARMELRVVLEEMVDLLPDFELAPGFVAPRRFGVIMGIDALELVVPVKQG